MHDLLHIDGKPFVLVPMHEYRRLVNGNWGDESNLPEAVLDQLAAGNVQPVKTLRRHRGMTQMDLAQAAGISRPYLTEIETGKKPGSVHALKSLAAALSVDVSLLIPPQA